MNIRSINFNLTEDQKEYLKDHWLIIFGGTVLTIVVISFVVIMSGILNCEKTTIRNGVYQICKCSGLEIKIKNTTNTGELQTICIGAITRKNMYNPTNK